MSKSKNILLIEDDEALASSIAVVLTEEDFHVSRASDGEEGLRLAKNGECDLILTDMKLPGVSGVELVRLLRSLKKKTPIIVMTAHGTTETMIECTKLGAYDYLVKPFEMSELLDLVKQAINVLNCSTGIETEDAPPVGLKGIIGKSRLMQNIFKEVGRLAAKDVTALIQGETGTGKEIVARALHRHSERGHKPFIAVNCAAIPDTLLESELFGYEKGAFTGAANRKIGRFEEANGGVLFLDEIGDLPISLQAKLLRVFQDKAIQRLGGSGTTPIDVRIITATHVNLAKAVEEEKFREDLFYRLNTAVIHIPPLRDRREDIPLLARYFLRRLGEEFSLESPSIQAEALDFLCAQPWPGNVRQLENVLRKALIGSRGYTVTLDALRHILAEPSPQRSSKEQNLSAWINDMLGAAQRGEVQGVRDMIVGDVEKELLTQALLLANGNQAKTARWLGISRLTLREKLHKWNISLPNSE